MSRTKTKQRRRDSLPLWRVCAQKIVWHIVKEDTKRVESRRAREKAVSPKRCEERCFHFSPEFCMPHFVLDSWQNLSPSPPHNTPRNVPAEGICVVGGLVRRRTRARLCACEIFRIACLPSCLRFVFLGRLFFSKGTLSSDSHVQEQPTAASFVPVHP